MNTHDQLKNAHENAVIEQFVTWYSHKTGDSWTIAERPDPPDAIITSRAKTSWIECADLFRSNPEAEKIMSYLRPNRNYTPRGRVKHPDCKIAFSFMRLLRKKLSKPSYLESYEKYGQGILLISEQDPMFNQDTFDAIDQITEMKYIADDRGYFREIYLGYRENKIRQYAKVTYRSNYTEL